MTDGWMPCSDSSLDRQDPLDGTAGYGERWFLVEIDGAWGEHALLQSRLDPALGRALVTRIERAGIRPLAIRRTGRRADERRVQSRWRWAYVDARAGRETVRWGAVDDPRMLLEIPLDGTAGEESSDPVIAVCTHARHDQCCAVKGRPVVTALARAYPKLTWECSHLGGDRFAATMVVFPHGLFYGRVHASDAPGIIEHYRNGVVDERYFRGRSSVTNATQAAQSFARSARRDPRIDKTEGLCAVGVHQASRCTCGQCGGHELAAIHRVTRPGDEAVTRLHAAAVGVQRAGDLGSQPTGGSLGRCECRLHVRCFPVRRPQAWR